MYNSELTDAQFRNIGNQVDVLTQTNLKQVPRSRLVQLNGVPFDVHSLHTYFLTGTQKHPIYPKKTIPKNVINKIRNKAISTNWKPQANTGNSRIPNHLKNFAAKQARTITQGRKRQRKQQAAHILGGNRNAVGKVHRIATHIQQGHASNRIAVPREGFTMAYDKVGGQVTGIRMMWGPMARATLYPLAQTNFGLLPRPVAPSRIAQAFWVMEAPIDTTVPGTTKSVAQMSEALAATLGLVIDQSIQQHELIEDIRTSLDYVDQETKGSTIQARLKAVLQAVRSLDRRCARGGDCGISMVRPKIVNGRIIMTTDTTHLRHINVNGEVKNIMGNAAAQFPSVVLDVVPVDVYVSIFVSADHLIVELTQA